MPASRVAIVGTGHRAQLFTAGLASRPAYDVVGLCDPSPTRMAFHNKLLAEHGRPAAWTWAPGDFDRLLQDVPDLVVVTSPDATHDDYIVRALRAGARVITEKAMTTDTTKARRIMAAVRDTGGDLTVAFNYRFNPVHAKVRDLLRSGAIGDVLSVHFEWLLDVRHGADYFRRWHRERVNSGGLMVHKASHHFDLVNWWLAARPVSVYGQGRLAFYGANGKRTGYARDYVRAHGSPAAQDDPFAIHLADNPSLRALYLEAEVDSGYLRDQNVFGDGITIEDDMALVIGYDTGASMSYHLTAYSPWEGYRVMFNGTGGRLELEVEEALWTQPAARIESAKGSVHGDLAAETAGGARILVRRLWQPPEEVTVPAFDHGGHGGGDQRMLAALLDGTSDQAADRANAEDGLLALLPGLGANESFRTGRAVDITTLLDA
ncbi:oxidoreductase family protein [Asanoa ferruginea]|uniref:Oxidoreductase family protein n=1 Tax=Asanoa ferruginea TaxID=53367 RepID=A0A3D9ZS96_9ACTN|nr:Gfo/Idh/MocA family oxidoreductase [Asanoa ferruginea]REG00028.1 oxidoreductase family protein [Asanoa ferruginea]GIF53722.1 dehydrogenase [Asanoa ferruginea]